MILNKEYFLLLGLIAVISCNTQTAQITNSLKGGGSTYDLMHGNKLETDKYGKLSLNAGLTTSENKEYYFLKLDYKHPESIPHIYPGDILIITIDGIDLELDAFYVEPSEKHVISYYYIDKLDLIDLGNANSAIMKVYGGNQTVDAEFTKKNIRLFHEFINSHVFSEVMIPAKEISKNWGFLGVGGGTSHNIWLGLFAEQLKINFAPNLTDFGSLGIGYTEFDYEKIYNRGENIESVKEPIWIFGTIYGLTYPVNWLTNWSLDIGITLQFYHYNDEDWQKILSRVKTNPNFTYRVLNGEPYSGTTVGAFIQAGSFWYSINTFGAWNLGVSIPIKQ